MSVSILTFVLSVILALVLCLASAFIVVHLFEPRVKRRMVDKTMSAEETYMAWALAASDYLEAFNRSQTDGTRPDPELLERLDAARRFITCPSINERPEK